MSSSSNTPSPQQQQLTFRQPDIAEQPVSSSPQEQQQVQESSSQVTASSSQHVPQSSNQNPLDSRWVFWFYSKFASWGSSLKPLYTVNTYTEFEEKLYKVIRPSRIQAKTQIFITKKGIIPNRSDKRNSEGGCWAMFIPVDYQGGKELLDALWYRLAKEVVAGSFPQDDSICGVGVATRKTQPEYSMRVDEYGVQRFDPTQINRDRVELWTWQATDRGIQYQIGRYMKNLLNVPELPLTYRNHHEMMAKRGQETIMYEIQ
eukprot:TRINITY_DN3127_c0_g1_i5.p1 TRINITY_DN3127_c0_g1~~TRINITY_DN3127_c0_g1_i5.p1  ORF type:complete len:260 (-),score=19.09 TRINITY_DN3127_c0_g1_i5:3246-4025(-)